MPFAAAAAIIGGASVSAAVAAISVVGTLEVVGAVGAVLSVVGDVTKNKTLTDVGLTLGVVGGVGALAAGAGLFGADAASGASLFGDTSGATGSIADDVTQGSEDVLNGADGSVDSIVTDTGEISTDSTSPLSAVMQNVSNAESAIPDDVTQGSEDVLNAAPPNAVPTPGAASTGAVSSSTSNSNSGFLGNLFGNMSDNQKAAATYGLIQAGGSLVSGMFNPMTPAQINALNAQASANNASAALTNLQRANLAQSRPVTAQVTGSVAPPAGSGMINSAAAPAATAPVTGTALPAGTSAASPTSPPVAVTPNSQPVSGVAA